MTSFQQTLGRYYKWWYILQYNFKSTSLSIKGNLINIVAETVRILAIVYVWYYKGSETNVFVYLLLGQIFKSFGENYFYNRFADQISTGKITSKLLLPTNNESFFGIGGIGYRIPLNLAESVAPIFALIVLQVFGGVNLIQNLNILRFVKIMIFFLPITYAINYFIGYFVGSLAFFVKDKKETWGISTTANNLISVMRGTIIPLDKIPFQLFFSFMPTSFALHHPMQIYLGKYSQIEIIQTFGGGIIWCFILWILARLIFKIGLKKNEAVGL
jgi:ABC-2 type transport system permease protein